MSSRFKVGLALGGGAARAFSHIGVISALEQHRIPIDVIAGTSMGAIIGAIYATHCSHIALRQRIGCYLESAEFKKSGFDFFKKLDAHGEGLLHDVAKMFRRGVFNALAVTRTAMVADEIARSNYAILIDDQEIEQTHIPFAATALDLQSGETVYLNKGSLRQAIAASCAMPGVLNPVKIGDRLLVDGGWTEAVPVRAALELGADCVIAVDVGGGLPAFDTPRNSIDIIARADALVRYSLCSEQLIPSDIVLKPKNGIRHWADFSSAEQSILSGEQEVIEHLGQIRRAIRRARLRHFLGRKHPGSRWSSAVNGNGDIFSKV